MNNSSNWPCTMWVIGPGSWIQNQAVWAASKVIQYKLEYFQVCTTTLWPSAFIAIVGKLGHLPSMEGEQRCCQWFQSAVCCQWSLVDSEHALSLHTSSSSCNNWLQRTLCFSKPEQGSEQNGSHTVCKTGNFCSPSVYIHKDCKDFAKLMELPLLWNAPGICSFHRGRHELCCTPSWHHWTKALWWRREHNQTIYQTTVITNKLTHNNLVIWNDPT